jgi:hypothetical protein
MTKSQRKAEKSRRLAMDRSHINAAQLRAARVAKLKELLAADPSLPLIPDEQVSAPSSPLVPATPLRQRDAGRRLRAWTAPANGRRDQPAAASRRRRR